MVRIERGGCRNAEVEEILRALPDWFGREDSNREYVDSARTLDNYAAIDGDDVVGVCLVRRHNPHSSEIHLIAVRPEHHRQGAGRALVAAVESDARADGVRLLQVKTYGPSGNSVPYERTRLFYEALGFIAMEENTAIWGEDNPCLILVKPLDGR